MGVRRFDIEAGGDSFSFAADTEPKIAFWLAKYPDDRKRSAVIPMLWLAQKDNQGWLSEPAMREVAERLEMPYIRVYEVATFYTMFRLQPVGKHHIQLCGTTPCMLRGASDLKSVCEKLIGPKMQMTDDGKLSWEEVECLGACANAPMVQINDYYYEDLDPEILEVVLGKLSNGVDVEPGPQVQRQKSAPIDGLTSLMSEDLYNGTRAEPIQLPNLPEQAAPEPEKTSSFAAAASVVKDVVSSDADSNTNASDDADGAPSLVERPEAGADDLKRIKGIGPKNEDALNELGIFAFAQIAEWNDNNIKWVEQRLDFPGRIERENWVSQAKLLAAGVETEFSKRVDAGEVETSKDEDS